MEAEDDEIVLKVSSSKPVPSQPRPETILELINTISLSGLEAIISDSDMNVIVQLIGDESDEIVILNEE